MVYNIGIYSRCKYDTKSNCYKTWKNMLQRCYDEKLQQKYPSYKGCQVSDEWLKFENFAKWYESNYKNQYQLDKDILGNGKLYSKDTCCFIPNKINSFFHNNIHRKGCFPTGVRKEGNKYRVVINIGINKKRHIGYYFNSQEAKKEYDIAKHSYLLEILQNYNLSEKIINALIIKT